MFGLIVKETKKGYFTNLKEVLDVVGDLAKTYNWLLSSYTCSSYPSDKIPFDKDFVWLTGDELVSLLDTHEIQFIWGVFTAYSKDISLDNVLQSPIPFADGYTGFWKPDVTIQNPLSDIEIVSWDNTFLLIIAKSKDIISKFNVEYPNSVDLAEYNK